MVRGGTRGFVSAGNASTAAELPAESDEAIVFREVLDAHDMDVADDWEDPAGEKFTPLSLSRPSLLDGEGRVPRYRGSSI